MKTRNRRLLLALLVLCILISNVRAEDGARKKTFMWEVKSPKATVYLLGSIHMAKEDMYPLPDVIEKAFEKSDALVVEMDVNAVNPLEMLKYATYQDTSTLKGNLKPEMYTKLVEMFKKYNMSEEAIKRFKPWFATMTLISLELMSAGYKQDLGIDMHFLNKAKEQKKKVLELESFKEQVKIFDEDLKGSEDIFLEYSLTDFEMAKSQVDTMVMAWKNGDAEMMDRLTTAEMQKYPEFESISQVLIERRNLKMTNKILNWLEKGGTYFVVVGSAHLTGDAGIVSLLGKGGKFRIEQK